MGNIPAARNFQYLQKICQQQLRTFSQITAPPPFWTVGLNSWCVPPPKQGKRYSAHSRGCTSLNSSFCLRMFENTNCKWTQRACAEMDLKTPGGCCSAAPTLLVDLQTGSCAAGEQLSKGFPWLSSPCFFVQADVDCWGLLQSYAFDDHFDVT